MITKKIQCDRKPRQGDCFLREGLFVSHSAKAKQKIYRSLNNASFQQVLKYEGWLRTDYGTACFHVSKLG